MNTTTTTKILSRIKIVILAVIFALGLQYVAAESVWVSAPNDPPNHNVDTPINVGNGGALGYQSKLGALWVNTGNIMTTGLVVSGGVSPIRIVDNTPTDDIGKVLTSDGAGYGSWQTPASGLGWVYINGGSHSNARIWAPNKLAVYWPDANDHSPSKICRDAGFTAATGMCRGTVWSLSDGRIITQGSNPSRITETTSSKKLPYEGTIVSHQTRFDGGGESLVPVGQQYWAMACNYANGTNYVANNGSTTPEYGGTTEILCAGGAGATTGGSGGTSIGTTDHKWYIVNATGSVIEVAGSDAACYNSTANRDHPVCPAGMYQSGMDMCNPTGGGNIGIAIRCTTI